MLNVKTSGRFKIRIAATDFVNKCLFLSLQSSNLQQEIILGGFDINFACLFYEKTSQDARPMLISITARKLEF